MGSINPNRLHGSPGDSELADLRYRFESNLENLQHASNYTVFATDTGFADGYAPQRVVPWSPERGIDATVSTLAPLLRATAQDQSREPRSEAVTRMACMKNSYSRMQRRDRESWEACGLTMFFEQ